MGILPIHIEMLREASSAGLIHGKALVISNQSVIGIDQFKTSNNKEDEEVALLDCKLLLRHLGAAEVSVCGIESDGVDFYLDLNECLTQDLIESYDLVIDFGTTEHVFNTSRALRNLSLMCRIGGTVICSAPCSNAVNHGYVSISPCLMDDVFSKEIYSKRKMIARVGSPWLYERKSILYEVLEPQRENLIVTDKQVEIIFFGRKTSQDREDTPIQLIYRSKHRQTTNRVRRFRPTIVKCLRSLAMKLPYTFEKAMFRRHESGLIRRIKNVSFDDWCS